MYKCVMVVACLYGYIDKQTDGIDRHGDRHRDREAQRYGDIEQREAIHPDAYLSGLVGSVHFGSVHFGSVRIFCLHKKIF